MKQQSRKGKSLRFTASIFETFGGSRWAGSVDRLRAEAAAADKKDGHRKRTQFKRLKELRS